MLGSLQASPPQSPVVFYSTPLTHFTSHLFLDLFLIYFTTCIIINVIITIIIVIIIIIMSLLYVHKRTVMNY